MASRQTSVSVAHPHALVLDGLCRTIEEAGFVVSDKTTTMVAALKSASDRTTDVAVIDFRLMRRRPDLVQKLNSETGAAVAILRAKPFFDLAYDSLSRGVLHWRPRGDSNP